MDALGAGAPRGRAEPATHDLARLASPFEIVAFDWDGTAVVNRKENGTAVCRVLERLLRTGAHAVVITGTHLGNVAPQLEPLLAGPHTDHLWVATNRGSEVWGFRGREPYHVRRRTASDEEERQLSAAAEDLRDLLRARGLETKIVYDRLNRRKVDLVPLPEWADPPKDRIGELLVAVQARLADAGVDGGLQEVMDLAAASARKAGLNDARITSDVKNVEIGLTDKSDSMDWMIGELGVRLGVLPAQMLVLGDEFGWVGGVEGSDHRMVVARAHGAVFASVGPEPGGLPPGILHAGGGPARFRRIIESVAAVRERAQKAEPRPFRVGLPLEPTADPSWLVVEEGADLARERPIESLFSVGNGYLGTRGALAEGGPFYSAPATFLAGVFDVPDTPHGVPEFAVAPDWTQLRILTGGVELRMDQGTVLEHRRVLDLRQGCTWRVWRHRDPEGRTTQIRGLRLASLADRHLLLQSVEITPENWSGRLRIEARLEPAAAAVAGRALDRPRLQPDDDPESRSWSDPAVVRLRTPRAQTTVAMAHSCRLHGAGRLAGRESVRGDGELGERWDLDVRLGETYRFDRLVSVHTSRDTERPVHAAGVHLRHALDGGAEQLAAAHAAAWRERWQTADVQVTGDDEARRALRFAAYHLVIAANPADERVSIGARTLTGESYKGHVFWDTDIFMVPFFVFTDPPAARALLMYRWHTLPAARDKAQSIGCRGALYAWESADTGEETTPRYWMSPEGEVIPILSGIQEHHISADVAYAVWQYWLATGDDEFLAGPGAEILIETARFWATRGDFGDDGLYHIEEIIGPDEYHEGVDDNAYTNVLARWNLLRAVQVARDLAQRRPAAWDALRRRLDLAEEEVRGWETVAAAMYTGLDPATGVFEQFRGFDKLQDYDLAPLRARGKRAAALDALLGRDRTLRSKIVKQADVVMLLDLLWEQFPPEVREANFRRYEPLTCHGSSLSPATHALVAARLGDLRTAEEYFLQAARIDLGDNMGNAGGGVHAAALGGLWRAAVLGFAGVHATEDGLRVAPRLLRHWRSLVVPLVWRGSRLVLRADHDSLRVRVESGAPVRILPEGAPAREVRPGEEQLLRLAGPGRGRWEPFAEVQAGAPAAAPAPEPPGRPAQAALVAPPAGTRTGEEIES